MHQGTGDRQFLLHPPTPVLDPFLTTFPETDVGEQFPNSVLSICFGHSPDTGIKFEVCLGAELLIQSRLIQERASACPHLVGLAYDIET